ncbi:MAG: response regulator [Halobacteriales archaeon]
MTDTSVENPVVLIVEDEQDLADVYAEHLEDLYDVRLAYTGAGAIELLDETVDVVLLDRKLPEASGRQFLDRLIETEIDCRVAMVTGVDPDFSLLDMQVDDYLVKPVTQAELRRTVALLINLGKFSEPIQEVHALASKQAVIEEEMDPAELAGDEAYREAVLQDVADHELPAVLDDLMDDYQPLEASRPPFMWKWVHKLAPHNAMPFLDSEYQEEVATDKTLLILYITLLDDVLEKLGDQATYWELSNLPRPRAEAAANGNGVYTEYVEFGQRVWELVEDRLQRAPEYGQFADLFSYDVRQAINAIEYTHLVINQPTIATMGDLHRYESHNMVMFAYADIDLMHTTAGLDSDHAAMREAVWHAQQMARIGNWVSTWERELREGDVSSGVVVYALEHEIIDHQELPGLTGDGDGTVEPLIDRIHDNDLEEYFFRRWTEHYEQLETVNDRIESFDLRPFIEGTEEVLRFHLASRGLK